MDNQTINLNNGFVAIFNDEREWIYKAVPFAPSVVNKTKEKPFLKLVEEIEEKYKHDFETTLATAIKDITKYLDVK